MPTTPLTVENIPLPVTEPTFTFNDLSESAENTGFDLEDSGLEIEDVDIGSASIDVKMEGVDSHDRAPTMEGEDMDMGEDEEGMDED